MPIIEANITLKKSNGITKVDLENRNPFIVKNCANKPKIVTKLIITNDFKLGNNKTCE